MFANLTKYWWALPTLSGVLMVLTFHPFDLWPLGFVALVPLYYAVAVLPLSRWKIFLSGSITGGLFAFSLSYFTLIQFHWLPETYLFVDAVRLLVVPITLIGASVCGLSLVLYRSLRSHNVLLNALVAAAVYVVAELLLQLIFGGYYLATLAYAAVPVVPLMSITAVGGSSLLSFVIAAVNGFVVEGLIVWHSHRGLWWRALGYAAAVCLLIFGPNYWYLHRPLAIKRTLSVAVVQVGQRDHIAFGTQKNGEFFWAEGSALAQAAAAQPNLLIYPFSPVEGALYRNSAPAFNKDVLVASESAVAAFMRGVAPSTTVMTWNNLYASGKFYNEFELWQGGRVVSEYQKRDLFPFMDYTPAWAQHIGLFSTPFDAVAGTADNHLMLGSVPLGDLMCSEIHSADLARHEASRAPLIVAAGSEAMFVDDVASSFSLRAAQLRAAENDVPVVRGNILGPSGIIDRFGALEATIGPGQGGTIAAPTALTAPRPTLYNRFGESLIIILLCGILGSAWYASRAKR